MSNAQRMAGCRLSVQQARQVSVSCRHRRFVDAILNLLFAMGRRSPHPPHKISGTTVLFEHFTLCEGGFV